MLHWEGLSVPYSLPSFDIISGVAVDYMYCLLEGISTGLSMLWFTPSPTDYYIGRHANLLNEQLNSIKPPETITRTPKNVIARKEWKVKVGFYLYPWDSTITTGIPTVKVESYLK